MALENYGNIKNAISNWLNRPDLESFFADFVRLAEARIYRELRIRTMEVKLDETTADGELAVPGDYVESKYLFVNSNPVQFLQRRTAEFIYEQYPTRSADGKPKFIAREAEAFIFGPFPDSDYQIKGVYYRRLPALSDQNPTNWFTDNAPDLLVFGGLTEAEPFIKNDARFPLWQARYNFARDSIEREEKRESHSGSTPRMTVSPG